MELPSRYRYLMPEGATYLGTDGSKPAQPRTCVQTASNQVRVETASSEYQYGLTVGVRPCRHAMPNQGQSGTHLYSSVHPEHYVKGRLKR